MKKFLLVLLVFGMAANVALGLTVTRGIQVDADDAEEHINTQEYSTQSSLPGDMESLTSSDLEFGSEGNAGLDWQAIGLQYDMLGIPQGATIISAKVTFEIDDNSNPGDSTGLTIFSELTTNASVFTMDAFNISSRTRSAASQGWSPAMYTQADADASNVLVDTPDIAALIQEVVDQAGWSANNRLTLMIFPDAWLNGEGADTTVQETEVEAGPGSDSAILTVEYIPEPATMCLLALGGLMIRRRRA